MIVLVQENQQTMMKAKCLVKSKKILYGQKQAKQKVKCIFCNIFMYKECKPFNLLTAHVSWILPNLSTSFFQKIVEMVVNLDNNLHSWRRKNPYILQKHKFQIQFKITLWIRRLVGSGTDKAEHVAAK